MQPLEEESVRTVNKMIFLLLLLYPTNLTITSLVWLDCVPERLQLLIDSETSKESESIFHLQSSRYG